MLDMPNNHNLFPLPSWAPALWRVPITLQLLNEAYEIGRGRRGSGPTPNTVLLSSLKPTGSQLRLILPAGETVGGRASSTSVRVRSS